MQRFLENHLNPVMLVFIRKLAKYSQMSTYMPGFQSCFSFLHHFDFCIICKISHYKGSNMMILPIFYQLLVLTM